jgi:hypothetical protein
MDTPAVPFAGPLSGHRTVLARWLDHGLAALDLSTQTRGAPNGGAHFTRERFLAQPSLDSDLHSCQLLLAIDLVPALGGGVGDAAIRLAEDQGVLIRRDPIVQSAAKWARPTRNVVQLLRIAKQCSRDITPSNVG